MPTRAPAPPTLIVFTRHPDADRPKKRLEPALGPKGTRRLHRAFLQDTLAAAQASGARIVLAHTAGPRFPEQAHVDACIVQRAEGLAARLDEAFSIARGLVPDGPLCLVGVHAPDLGPERLKAAYDRLDQHDVLIGPAAGTGFHLLGFRGAVLPLAESFATAEPLATFAAKASAGRRVAHLEPHPTVETPNDLEQLAARLRRAPADAPATFRVLDELGLMDPIVAAAHPPTWTSRS